MSIRYKIALLFAALVTAILSIVSLSVYFFSARERENIFRTRLRNRAVSTASVYASLKGNNLAILQKMDAASVASLYNKSVSIVGYNDAKPYMFSDQAGDSLYLDKKIIEKTKIESEYYFNYSSKKAIAIHHTDTTANFIIAVAALDIDGEQYLAQLKKILWIALVTGVTISFFTGLFFAKNLIWPMAKIMGEVNLITSNNLSQRIKINTAKDELTLLAQTFNSLLDRLQESFSSQRRFISNASHELSTPLTAIISQIEVALQQERSGGEYTRVLNSVLDDAQELQQLTLSLLNIAKAGSQGGIDLSEIRIDDVLLKVSADLQKQHADYIMSIEFESYPDDENLLTVFGNANLLYIALKNIIENGCKYSENSEALIFVAFNERGIAINISSKGDIIAEADIDNIFQPFFRTNGVQNKPGFGLGLTLAKRIMSLHKGTIDVVSNADAGTVFTIRLTNVSGS